MQEGYNVISQKKLESCILDRAGKEKQSEGLSRRNRVWWRYTLRKEDSLEAVHTNWQFLNPGSLLQIWKVMGSHDGCES